MDPYSCVDTYHIPFAVQRSGSMHFQCVLKTSASQPWKLPRGYPRTMMVTANATPGCKYVETSTNAIVKNDNTEQTRNCVAVGPVGNCQGSVKCFDNETGKILHRRTVTKLYLLLDNRLLRKVIEVWGKGAWGNQA